MNDLVGLIPRSNQFSTFENDSYVGNLGLCGVPLTRKCNDESGPKEELEDDEEEEDGYFIDGFGWKSVVMGYGCGLIVGIGTGCCVFRYGKPRWLVEFFSSVGYDKKRKRRNRATPTQRRS